MPKKGAPPAGGDDKKATPKVEKTPAAVPAEEKKPAQAKGQPKQQQDNKQDNKQAKPQDNKPQAKHTEPQDNHTNQTSSPAVSQERRTYTLSDDPVEAGIQQRLNTIEDEISAHRAEIDKIRDTIEVKKQSQNALKEEQAGYIQQTREIGNFKIFQERRSVILDKLKDTQRVRKHKWDDFIHMKTQLGPAADGPDFLKKLDNDIRALETRQASGDVGKLADEKKLIAEIGKLQANKKIFKNYAELREAIKIDDSTISNLRADLKKVDDDRKVFDEKKGAVNNQITESRNKQDNASADIKKDIDSRKELQDRINELRDRASSLRDQLKEFRNDKREARNAEIARSTQQRQEENKKRQEEKKQQELKRLQEELEKGPYAEELELCTQLMKYLEPFKPKAPEAAAEDAGSDEGAAEASPTTEEKAPHKRGGKGKKAASGEELRHGPNTFLQFETVSIAPPSKPADVESTIAQIIEKKEYYEKKSDEKRAKQKLVLAAKLNGSAQQETTNDEADD